MKKYLLLFAALSLASAATARNPRKTSRAARLQAAEAAADSLRAVTTRQAAVIDSLQCIAVCPEEECAPAEEPRRAEPDPRTPEQIAADSVADMRRRMERKEIRSTFDTESLTVIDTLDSGNEALYVVLFSDNSWKYVRNREVAKDSTIFEKYWDTKSLFPYSSVTKSLQRCGQSARQVRPAPRTAASGRRSAAPHARHDLRHLLRPRAHLANRPGVWQPGHHPP